MRTIFALYALLPVLSVQAQQAKDTVFMAAAEAAAVEAEDYCAGVFYHEPGDTAWVFADSVRLRALPGLSAPVMDVLPQGARVLITANDSTPTRLQERSAYWYGISCQGKTGYVWGGNLAIDQVHQNDTLYLFGISGTQQKKSKESDEMIPYVTGSIKIFKGARLLSEATFDAGNAGNLSGSQFEMTPAPGLQNVSYILTALVSGEACGVPTIVQHFLVTGGRLLPLPRLESVSDADIYYHSESVGFPQTSSGANSFTISIEEGETVRHTKEGHPVVSGYERTLRYSWDGAGYCLISDTRKDFKNRETGQ